jgi:hypothetical protein
MPKRKTKRKPARSQTRQGFKLCKHPIVPFVDNEPLRRGDDRNGPTLGQPQPFLLAIARDSRSIFAAWNIDWRSVFHKEIPADRKVHLRAIGQGGVIEATAQIEPVNQMHYLAISGLYKFYRVEIGYFQPFSTWHSVMLSDDVEVPPHAEVARADVELATIPFHVSFSDLASLLGGANGIPIAKTLSARQKRLSSSDDPNELTQTDTHLLSALNLSVGAIAAAERDYKEINSEQLARHARVTARATSPLGGFQGNAGS